MNRKLLRAALPALVTTTALLMAAGSAAAAPGDTPALAQSATIVLNDGTVLDSTGSITFSFEGEAEPATAADSDGGFHTMSCPEVNDKPTYTVKGTPYFLEDKDEPKSTWLLPRQTVSWAVTGSHTFTWEIGAGAEAEAGAILAKAKVKVDTKISNSWTWSGTQTVTDTNSTSKAYRAVLGQVGWKLTTVKEWIAAPCTPKKKTIVIKAPRKGDMSIGRQKS
ncbi:hypothetical protein COUCH_05575 [Couchioplanes caeruleus]|uniref:hypothetical protein n=1 Tax=Couchioplanes caeruleus TaxID=56438 RepID=UPI0020C1688A|nr:hypothetical protein [Couchioplanes caeruleus]UQU65789.1 hypothetical protein COUCH_05575 [Couchioplanes caeruleus]